MQFQRIAPTQMLVSGPPDAVREATWYALLNVGVMMPTIDVPKNLVSGTQGDGVLTSVRVVTARFEMRPEGTLVSFEEKPLLGSSLDFGTAKKRAANMANSLERIIAGGFAPPEVGVASSAPIAAPIADPNGGVQSALPMRIARPIYGEVRAPKRGATLLIYGILSALLCQILAPLTLIYGFGTLRDYKRQGDPGDKALVLGGMAIAGLVCLAIVAFIAASNLGW